MLMRSNYVLMTLARTLVMTLETRHRVTTVHRFANLESLWTVSGVELCSFHLRHVTESQKQMTVHRFANLESLWTVSGLELCSFHLPSPGTQKKSASVMTKVRCHYRQTDLRSANYHYTMT